MRSSASRRVKATHHTSPSTAHAPATSLLSLPDELVLLIIDLAAPRLDTLATRKCRRAFCASISRLNKRLHQIVERVLWADFDWCQLETKASPPIADRIAFEHVFEDKAELLRTIHVEHRDSSVILRGFKNVYSLTLIHYQTRNMPNTSSWPILRSLALDSVSPFTFSRLARLVPSMPSLRSLRLKHMPVEAYQSVCEMHLSTLELDMLDSQKFLAHLASHNAEHVLLHVPFRLNSQPERTLPVNIPHVHGLCPSGAIWADLPSLAKAKLPIIAKWLLETASVPVLALPPHLVDAILDSGSAASRLTPAAAVVVDALLEDMRRRQHHDESSRFIYGNDTGAVNEEFVKWSTSPSRKPQVLRHVAQPQTSIPNQFRAAQFTQKSGPLELKQTQLGEVKANECVIKVRLCALHSTDEMLKHDLLPDMRYPMSPGGVVVGEIVKSAQQGKRGLKEGTRIVAISFMRGLAEYCAVNESMVVELPKNFQNSDKQLEAPVCAFDATRIWVAHERCHDELKRMPDAERRLAKDLNERMGFEGDGVLVVYGEGGFAKVALDTIKMAKEDRKVILVASSDRWSAGNYGLKDDCMLVVGKHNLADELKKMGGAQGVMCVDMPMQRFGQLLDGCRFHSSIVVLSPCGAKQAQMPIANLLAKSLTLYGQPLVTHKHLEHVMQLADKHGLRAPVKQFQFDEGQVRAAWSAVEGREQFEASIVVVSQQQ